MIFLFGILLGLLSATITESLGHKFTGHPTRLQKRLYKRFPKLFFPFLKPLYQHLVIHHHKTFQGDFFNQFRSSEDKLVVDSWIAKKFVPSFSTLVWEERYNLTLKGLSGTVPFAIPFCLGPAIIFYTLGPWAFAGSLLTAYIPVWLSKYVHPLVHLPEETYAAGPFVRWLMRTGYMRRVFRNHYLHHQDGDTNYNLLLGGDYLVFLHRKATFQEELDLQELLPEFDRRVRLTAPENMTSEFETKDYFTRAHQEYFALRNPTFEDRFQHQRIKAKLYSAALKKNWADVLADVEIGTIDHKMKLTDKNVDIRKWADRPEFNLTSYQFENNEVTFRNIKFKTGDLLFTTQASDSDGIYSTLLEGKVSFTHVAVYALLNYKGQSYPSVIHMDEYGVHAIPLKAFVGKKYNTYIEVFRADEELSTETQNKIEAASFEMMGEDHSFDIYQDSSQSQSLNCARTVLEIYRRAGYELTPKNSYYSDKTLPNLKILGIDKCYKQPLLMPGDLATNCELRIIGSIDNAAFEDIVVRTLVREKIQEIWQNNILNQSRFPLAYSIHRFIIDRIQRNVWYSFLLLPLTGLTRRQFPNGPLTFLSLASTSNKRMEMSVQRLRDSIVPHRHLLYSLPTWAAIKEHFQISVIVTAATNHFLDLYTQPEDSLELYQKSTEVILPVGARPVKSVG